MARESFDFNEVLFEVRRQSSGDHLLQVHTRRSQCLPRAVRSILWVGYARINLAYSVAVHMLARMRPRFQQTRTFHVCGGDVERMVPRFSTASIVAVVKYPTLPDLLRG